MLEWMCAVFVVFFILGVIIVHKSNDLQTVIVLAAIAIVVISFFGAMFSFIACVNSVDVKVIINDGNTYLAKGATYNDDKITLDLREINVATNELIGPQFLHVRTISRLSPVIVTGDIIIYQDGEIRHWVSPF